ncbi:response regulator transcription factor [Natroniella acetigena]|uniref:response regulator transcription factor n=1 Tax=Natroniella acetigena TaxID=52004 RepID=UPI00200A9819|nr:response regulator transcription factor [Natroniella acetigena]MCK8827595.1 response regulator transcription factor [Natroniella acetigena]
MSKDKILIIDDDKNICQILKEYFEFENFQVVIANDGAEGLEEAESENPNLIILDIMLPEIDGWKICQKLRPQNDTPIIILSAKTKETDRITGLELGADDYVTKPFSPKEVVARAKAVLRRTDRDETDSDSLQYPKLKINKSYRAVNVGTEQISLTPKEFDLLWTLAAAPRQVFPREKLLRKVWGYDYFGDIRTVDTHIKSLRKKLGAETSDYIQTVWGVGYKFEVAED